MEDGRRRNRNSKNYCRKVTGAAASVDQSVFVSQRCSKMESGGLGEGKGRKLNGRDANGQQQQQQDDCWCN